MIIAQIRIMLSLLHPFLTYFFTIKCINTQDDTLHKKRRCHVITFLKELLGELCVLIAFSSEAKV